MKPLPLKLCTWILLIGGAGGLLGLAIAPLDLQIYSLGGETLAGRTFLSQAGIPFGLTALLFLVTGIALVQDRHWTRLAILGSILAYGASAVLIGARIHDFALEGNAGFGSIFLLIAAIVYLYRNQRVRAYYAQFGRAGSADGA